jgi:hypothetical protein
MAFLGEEIAVSSLPESTSYDPLPAGWYEVKVSGAELKDTKNGTGQYISVKYDVLGPSHQGRIVFGNLNIRNANPKAEEIGRRQLGDLMRSIGLDKVRDTDQLIGGVLKIKLDIRPATDGYAAQNEVREFKAMEGSAPPKVSAPAEGSASPAKAAPPWAKK